MTTPKPRLAVTLGDVRGIGPEIVAASRDDARVREAAELLVVGPSGAGTPVDDVVGVWTRGGSEALGGRLAGTLASVVSPERNRDRGERIPLVGRCVGDAAEEFV